MIPRLEWVVWLMLALGLSYLATAAFIWVRAAQVSRPRRRGARALVLVATVAGTASLGLLGRGARNCANVASFEAIFARAGDDVGQVIPIDGSIASTCRSGAVQNVSAALALWLAVVLLLLTAGALIRQRRREPVRDASVTPQRGGGSDASGSSYATEDDRSAVVVEDG